MPHKVIDMVVIICIQMIIVTFPYRCQFGVRPALVLKVLVRIGKKMRFTRITVKTLLDGTYILIVKIDQVKKSRFKLLLQKALLPFQDILTLLPKRRIDKEIACDAQEGGRHPCFSG